MRREALSRELEDLGAAALVVVARSSRDPDLAPFVGNAHLGAAILAWPRSGPPRLAFLTPMERDEAAATGLALITPADLEIERLHREHPDPAGFQTATLERTLAAAGIPPGRIALAGRAGAGVVHEACVRLETRGWTFLAGEDIVRQATKHKDGSELAVIRAAAAGTCAAFRHVASLLAAAETDASTGPELWLGGEKLRVGRVRSEIAVELARHGLSEPQGSIVAAGEEGAVPHNQGNDERVLRAGESLVVDLFPQGGLFADCTRTFCVGTPHPELFAAHEAVCAALDAAQLEAQAGVRGWTLQENACRRLAEHGYPTPITHPGTTVGYVHGLGHGVGFELHEYPSFRKQAGREGVFEVGDVFTLEPGLYDQAAGWAVRIEDLFRLGSKSLETLTVMPRTMDPREWN